jgi:hypothetical protein
VPYAARSRLPEFVTPKGLDGTPYQALRLLWAGLNSQGHPGVLGIMDHEQIQRMIEAAIESERRRIVMAIRSVRVPTQATEAGFVEAPGFEDFREAIAEAIEGA